MHGRRVARVTVARRALRPPTDPCSAPPLPLALRSIAFARCFEPRHAPSLVAARAEADAARGGRACRLDTLRAEVHSLVMMIVAHKECLYSPLRDVTVTRSFACALRAELPLMTAVARETLRLFPPVPFVGRVATADAVVEGAQVQRVMLRRMTIASLHH